MSAAHTVRVHIVKLLFQFVCTHKCMCTRVLGCYVKCISKCWLQSKSLKNTSSVTATTLLNESVVRKEIIFVNGTMLTR